MLSMCWFNLFGRFSHNINKEISLPAGEPQCSQACQTFANYACESGTSTSKYHTVYTWYNIFINIYIYNCLYNYIHTKRGRVLALGTLGTTTRRLYGPLRALVQIFCHFWQTRHAPDVTTCKLKILYKGCWAPDRSVETSKARLSKGRVDRVDFFGRCMPLLGSSRV